MAGLCTSLLPILYDLCALSRRRKEYPGASDIESMRRIEQRLILWTTPPVPNLERTFRPQEVVHLHAQASMYRTASLLIAHRLLHPIGVLDDVARVYAEDIMLHMSKHLTSNASLEVPRNFVGLPVLVASLELEEVPRGTWDSITMLNKAPLCLRKILDLVDFVWRRRRAGYAGNIFDLIDEGPDFVVVP
jgi:hypothetical protein